MSLFNWDNDSSSSTNTVIEQPSEAEYQPEQNYDYDNPIIMELDTCDYWECQIGMKKVVQTLIFLVGGFTVMFIIGFVQTATTGDSFYDPGGYYNP